WEGATSDTWLAARFRERLGRADLLAPVAALGLVARLREPSSDDERRRSVAALLAGSHDAEADRERAWARALSPAETAEVAREAARFADTLRARLDALSDAPRADDPAWREE